MVNWYLSENVRLEEAYATSVLKQFAFIADASVLGYSGDHHKMASPNRPEAIWDLWGQQHSFDRQSPRLSRASMYRPHHEPERAPI